MAAFRDRARHRRRCPGLRTCHRRGDQGGRLGVDSLAHRGHLRADVPPSPRGRYAGRDRAEFATRSAHSAAMLVMNIDPRYGLVGEGLAHHLPALRTGTVLLALVRCPRVGGEPSRSRSPSCGTPPPPPSCATGAEGTTTQAAAIARLPRSTRCWALVVPGQLPGQAHAEHGRGVHQLEAPVAVPGGLPVPETAARSRTVSSLSPKVEHRVQDAGIERGAPLRTATSNRIRGVADTQPDTLLRPPRSHRTTRPATHRPGRPAHRHRDREPRQTQPRGHLGQPGTFASPATRPTCVAAWRGHDRNPTPAHWRAHA